MKQIIFAFVLVLGFGLSVFAQTQNSPCPAIDVSGVGGFASGEPLNFTVSVGGNTENLNLEYKWTVSTGTIIAGQGTRFITVNEPQFPSIGLTATVEVKGLPENCPNAFSEHMSYDPQQVSRLLVEFGNLSNSKVKAKIEALYLELGIEAGSQGFIINYGTEKEVASREAQIRNSIQLRRYDASRATIVRGGRNPKSASVWTKFFIVPPGADNPQP